MYGKLIILSPLTCHLQHAKPCHWYYSQKIVYMSWYLKWSEGTSWFYKSKATSKKLCNQRFQLKNNKIRHLQFCWCMYTRIIVALPRSETNCMLMWPLFCSPRAELFHRGQLLQVKVNFKIPVARWIIKKIVKGWQMTIQSFCINLDVT